jgi:hypothetical protein
MTSTRYGEIENVLIGQSTALIELASELEKHLGKDENWAVLAADGIKSGIERASNDRSRMLAQYENTVHRNAEAEIARAKTLASLQQIVDHLPDEWHAEPIADQYGDCRIKTDVGASLRMMRRYSRGVRGELVGTSLEVISRIDSRLFPQKKDGTYSWNKIIAFVNEQTEIYNLRQERHASHTRRNAELNAILKPYVSNTIYGLSGEIETDNVRLLIVNVGEGEYQVHRTTTQRCTAEELANILANEAPKVIRDEQNA